MKKVGTGIGITILTVGLSACSPHFHLDLTDTSK